MEPFQQLENIRAQELLSEQAQRDEQTLVVPEREDGSPGAIGKLGALLRAIFHRPAR